MTRSTTFGILAFAAALVGSVPATARADQAPAGTAAAATATPGSYLNLQPRRRLTQSPLFGQTTPHPRVARPSGSAAGLAPDVRSRVVCGMTLVPGNPAIDPGIQRPGASPAARPTIRAVEPSICWDAAPAR